MRLAIAATITIIVLAAAPWVFGAWEYCPQLNRIEIGDVEVSDDVRRQVEKHNRRLAWICWK